MNFRAPTFLRGSAFGENGQRRRKTDAVGRNGNENQKRTAIDFHVGLHAYVASAPPRGSIGRPSGRGPVREARLRDHRGKVDGDPRRAHHRNTRRKRLSQGKPNMANIWHDDGHRSAAADVGSLVRLGACDWCRIQRHLERERRYGGFGVPGRRKVGICGRQWRHRDRQ